MGEKEDLSWPLPKFHFEVYLGSAEHPAAFQEVSGLDTATPLAGSQKAEPVFKMAARPITNRVTLKNGLWGKRHPFQKWIDALTMNTVKREKVMIKLRDEFGKAVCTWTLFNAWPTKITGADKGTDADEITIETLEIAHEGIEINNGQ